MQGQDCVCFRYEFCLWYVLVPAFCMAHSWKLSILACNCVVHYGFMHIFFASLCSAAYNGHYRMYGMRSVHPYIAVSLVTHALDVMLTRHRLIDGVFPWDNKCTCGRADPKSFQVSEKFWCWVSSGHVLGSLCV